MEESNRSPSGSVMVVGGGIAGMQASLDLAEQGFKVYLIEQKSAIGGHIQILMCLKWMAKQGISM